MLIIKQTTTQPSSSKSQVKVFINSSYTSPASQLPYKLENLPRSHVILQHPYLYTLALWRTQTLVTNSPVPSRHIPQTATRVCGNSAVRSRSRHVFCGARETERELLRALQQQLGFSQEPHTAGGGSPGSGGAHALPQSGALWATPWNRVSWCCSLG